MNKPEIQSSLTSSGYKVVEKSDPFKNERANYHFKATKNGERYFIKIPHDYESENLEEKIKQLETVVEGQRIIAEVLGSVAGLKILVPTIEILPDGSPILVTPYIDIAFISYEKTDLQEFNLDVEDHEHALGLLTEALSILETSEIETPLGEQRTKDQDQVEVLKKIEEKYKVSDIYKGNEMLDFMKQNASEITDFRLAFSNFQYQKMAYDVQSRILYMIDLETARRRPLTWDISHIYFLAHTIYLNERGERFASNLLDEYLKQQNKAETQKIWLYFKYSMIQHAFFYLQHYREGERNTKLKKTVDKLLQSESIEEFLSR